MSTSIGELPKGAAGETEGYATPAAPDARAPETPAVTPDAQGTAAATSSAPEKPSNTVAAISDEIHARAWQLVAAAAETKECGLFALGQIYLAAGNKEGVRATARQLLAQGEVEEAQRLTAAIGEPIASKEFQEEGDLLLRDGNFRDAIKAYRGAALPEELSKAVFQQVLTAIEAAVKEGRVAIVQHTDYDECDAASAYCQAYEEVHGRPPSADELVEIGDGAPQRRVMQTFFSTALSEAAGRISKAPTGAEHNQRSQDFGRLQQDTDQRLFRRDLAGFLADDKLAENYTERFGNLAEKCLQLKDTESMKLLIARAEEDGRWYKALELREGDAFKQGGKNPMWPDRQWFEKAVDDPRSATLYVYLCKKAGFVDKLNVVGERALAEAAARGLKAMPEPNENSPGISSAYRRTFISLARECFNGAGNKDGLVRVAELMWRLGADALDVLYVYNDAKTPPPDDPAFYKKLGGEWIDAFKARLNHSPGHRLPGDSVDEAMAAAHAAYMKYIELSERQAPPAASETPTTTGQGPAETASQNPVAAAVPDAPAAPEALAGQGV